MMLVVVGCKRATLEQREFQCLVCQTLCRDISFNIIDVDSNDFKMHKKGIKSKCGYLPGWDSSFSPTLGG